MASVRAAACRARCRAYHHSTDALPNATPSSANRSMAQCRASPAVSYSHESRQKRGQHSARRLQRAAQRPTNILGIVKEIQAKVEEGRTHGITIDHEMCLRQMPSSWSHDERGQWRVRTQLIRLAARTVCDRAIHCIAKIHLALN